LVHRKILEDHQAHDQVAREGLEVQVDANCEARFYELRKQLTIAPVLVIPGMEKRFSIFCDASGHGLGCVLMQDYPVVAYTSRHLRKHEEHYPTPNLELAIVVHALKIWRYYLMEKRCELYTDRKSWKYFFMQSDFNFGQQRKLELIKDYDIGNQLPP
jgi:hypothetical protein